MADEAKKEGERLDKRPPPIADGVDYDPEVEKTIYARHQELESLKELEGKENQRGTPIPALFNQFYKFIQNPSTVSVETFKRMVDTDDTIGSGVDFLTTCLAARLGRYQHKSNEVTQWVNDRLDEIQGGWFNAVKQQASASWAGFSVSEKVWANTENGFVPKKIVSLPPTTLLFETDRTGEITPDGILQYQRNYNPIALAQGIGFYGGAISVFGFNVDAVRPDLFAKFGDLPFPIRSANMYNYLSVRIPKTKTIHWAFDAQGKFENPYGRSLLRRIYKYYVMKDAFLQMLSVALDRKGTPLTIVFADPNTTLVDPSQAQTRGSASGQTRGRYVGQPADLAAQQAFKNIHNDSFVILPGKKGQIYDTDFVPQDSNTESFIAALDFCNKSIMRGLLVPSLIFNNGDGTGSYSLGQEHSRTFNKILDGMIAGLEQTLIHQLVREMIAFNFPESAWKKDGLGDFSKREFEQDEIDKIMDMYEKGITNGIIDSNDLADLNKMRETIGFEERKTPVPPQSPFGGFPGMSTGQQIGDGFPPESPQGVPNATDTEKGKVAPAAPEPSQTGVKENEVPETPGSKM